MAYALPIAWHSKESSYSSSFTFMWQMQLFVVFFIHIGTEVVLSPLLRVWEYGVRVSDSLPQQEE